jgi:lipopolysaccharide export system protein LptC
MMPARSWVAMIGLALLAAIIFTVLERLETDVKRAKRVMMPSQDYEFFAVEYTALNQKGALRLALHAAHVTHARNADVLTLIQPRIERLADGDAAHVLEAKTAQVFNQGEKVVMNGEVRVISTPAGSARSMRFTTPTLTLYPEARRAQSDQHVEIQQDDATLSGVGLRADFVNESLEIEDDVHAQFIRPL